MKIVREVFEQEILRWINRITFTQYQYDVAIIVLLGKFTITWKRGERICYVSCMTCHSECMYNFMISTVFSGSLRERRRR